MIVLAAAAVLTGCGQQEKQNEKTTASPGIRVNVKELALSHATNKLKYSGSIEALVTTPLSFQTTGTVAHIYVHEGDCVRKGQLVAETEKATFQSAYDAAHAQYEQAVDAHARLKKVYDNGSLPEVKWVEIKSKLAQAESQLNICRENLENCELRSPAAGIIGKRELEVGMSAIQLQAPITIINIDEVYVKIPVTEDEISKLNKGDLASVTVPAAGNVSFEGTIDRIGVVANMLSRTYDVRIRVDNKEHIMKPGMVCNAEIMLPDSEPVLLLPLEAVSGQTSGSPYVFVVDPASHIARKKSIVLGGIINDKLEVLSGLSAGEKVVTYGKHKLSNNIKVSF